MLKTLRPYQQEVVNEIKFQLRQSDNPILVDASVGSGKSLIIATILLMLEHVKMRALCLTLNSTLIQQNADTYKLQGGNPGIYCAGLDAKDFEHLVIFGSPHSVCKDISNEGNISRQPFNLIIVDEAHNINPHDSSSMFMRIINHYGLLSQIQGHKFKIIGLTGTPYRGKGESIIGENQLFKTKACQISTPWLISEGYLAKPYFGLTQIPGFDFSQLRVNNMGVFNGLELQVVLDKNERLTAEIMREVVSVIENGRQGAFIFAATRKHCLECAKSLPDGQWEIIVGETPHHERKKILDRAQKGYIKYLVSVNCLNVGVDLPRFDVAAWLRPTESLILYTQGIGRVLRLHPEKTSALILDYAGNLERHGDIDDPIINDALQPRPENEKDYCIPCYTCGQKNTIHARRCISVRDNKRCEHFFTWKDCHGCRTKNDATSRYCRECNTELIDPNTKLKRKHATLELYKFQVKKANYSILPHPYNKSPSIKIFYKTINNRTIYESYDTSTEKSKNIFYANFVRKHYDNASDYYPYLNNLSAMQKMIKEGPIKTPVELICVRNNEFWKIKTKVFNNADNKS